jgi:hypothetical protein
MLNGIDPIIIFNFNKISPSLTESLSKIPIISSVVESIGLPPIPIYLSETLTGLFIESEEKSIEIQTSSESTSDGSEPIQNQKSLESTVTINMLANKDSIGLTLLSAVLDLIVPKVTSKEYSITYLHGAVTVFGGLLQSFNVTQNSENDLFNISLKLSKPGTPQTQAKTTTPQVTRDTGALPSLQGGG